MSRAPDRSWAKLPDGSYMADITEWPNELKQGTSVRSRGSGSPTATLALRPRADHGAPPPICSARRSGFPRSRPLTGLFSSVPRRRQTQRRHRAPHLKPQAHDTARRMRSFAIRFTPRTHPEPDPRPTTRAALSSSTAWSSIRCPARAPSALLLNFLTTFLLWLLTTLHSLVHDWASRSCCSS